MRYLALIRAVCVVMAFSIFALMAPDEPEVLVLKVGYADPDDGSEFDCGLT